MHEILSLPSVVESLNDDENAESAAFYGQTCLIRPPLCLSTEFLRCLPKMHEILSLERLFLSFCRDEKLPTRHCAECSEEDHSQCKPDRTLGILIYAEVRKLFPSSSACNRRFEVRTCEGRGQVCNGTVRCTKPDNTCLSLKMQEKAPPPK